MPVKCYGVFLCLFGVFACAPLAHAYDDAALSQCFDAATDNKFSPEALEACNRVVADRTAPARAHLAALQCRGMLYETQGMLDQAASDFSEHIRLAPDESRSYVSRMNVRIKIGDYHGVVDDATVALEKNSLAHDALAGMTKGEVLAVYYVRAQALERLGEIDRAVADYRNAGSLGKEQVERLQAHR
jgi:tetratricopeptide (TPR) repeat protein